jgi:hypothetical protein
MSEKADHTNILRNKGAKTRRTAEYTKTPGSNNLGPPNLSFTDHEPSLKN